MFKKINWLILMIFALPFVQDKAIANKMIENPKFDEVVKKYTNKFKSPLISVEELKNKMNRKSIVLLDSREINEYKTSKIKDAIYAGYDDYNFNSISNRINKKDIIIVYCSVGYRSGDIADKLNKQGYQAYNLYGGIFEWVNQGNEVFNSSGVKTNKVHAYNQSWSKWLLKGEKVYNKSWVNKLFGN